MGLHVVIRQNDEVTAHSVDRHPSGVVLTRLSTKMGSKRVSSRATACKIL